MKRIIVVLALYALVACGNPLAAEPTCQEQAAPALAQIQSAAREWDDANALAGQTPRSALAQQIESLQAARRKVQDITIPDCAAAVKQALVDSMDATIAGYIAFLGQKPDSTVQASFKTANDKMVLFGQEIVKLSATPVP